MKIKIAILAAVLLVTGCTEEKASFEFGTLTVTADRESYGSTFKGKMPIKMKNASLASTPMFALIYFQTESDGEVSEHYDYIYVIDGAATASTYDYVSGSDAVAPKHSGWKVIGYTPLTTPQTTIP